MFAEGEPQIISQSPVWVGRRVETNQTKSLNFLPPVGDCEGPLKALVLYFQNTFVWGYESSNMLFVEGAHSGHAWSAMNKPEQKKDCV